MKILIASDLHYPTINGVATFSRNLAHGLAARGHEVIVIAPSQTGKRYKEVDGNYVIVRTASVPFPFYQNFRISLNPNREVKKIISEFDPDVIHINMMLGIGQATMRYGNKFGIPIVSTNHAIPDNLLDNLKLLAPVSRPISYMLKVYGARFHAKADLVTMPTQSAIDMLDAQDMVHVPMCAVSNGIDLSTFKPTQPNPAIIEKFHLPTNQPIVSYVGRLDAEKHLSVLVRAFAQVRAGMSAHLLLVGYGTDSAHLHNLVDELGLLEDVTFTGKVSNDEIVQLHKVGTVFVMPSPAELQSIATLEAMASGQPVIAVDAGALAELCHSDKNGYLCEEDNDVQIAASITNILTHPRIRSKFSKESLAIAKTHDIIHTLDTFEKIYADLTKVRTD